MGAPSVSVVFVVYMLLTCGRKFYGRTKLEIAAALHVHYIRQRWAKTTPGRRTIFICFQVASVSCQELLKILGVRSVATFVYSEAFSTIHLVVGFRSDICPPLLMMLSAITPTH